VKTTINFILDRSGSMMSVWDATINGFNEYIQELKKDENEYNLTLTLFSTGSLQKLYDNADLNSVPNLTRETYHPDGGTALYDAVCDTLQSLKDATDKQLVVIMTDGEENSSQEYTESQFKALKGELEAKGNFTFVYLGANQNAWDNAQKWNFARQNVSSFNSTLAGTDVAFSNLSASTAIFARSASMKTANFMSVAQQKELEETK
jgi:von Willebrand factor type A domain